MTQNSLPTKTKIAAWWMRVCGGIALILFLGGIILFFIFAYISRGVEVGLVLGSFFYAIIFPIIGISFICIFSFFLPAIFLFSRQKWAWKMGVVLQIFVIIVSFFILSFLLLYFSDLYYYIFLTLITDIIFLPPLILLLLDRKNFWKVAS
jgi:hypothetical protein